MLVHALYAWTGASPLSSPDSLSTLTLDGSSLAPLRAYYVKTDAFYEV